MKTEYTPPFVCSGCGQPSPGALPDTDGRVYCEVAKAWVEVVHADSVAAKMAQGKLR